MTVLETIKTFCARNLIEPSPATGKYNIPGRSEIAGGVASRLILAVLCNNTLGTRFNNNIK